VVTPLLWGDLSDRFVWVVLGVTIAFAGIGPTLDARALETLGDDRDRYGRLRAWGSGAFIVVVAFTGALIERAGATSLFVVYVAAMAALAAISLSLRGAGAGPRLPRLDAIGVVLRHAPVLRFLPAVLLVWSASQGINWYFSIHLIELGAPGELVGSAWAIGALVEIPIMAAYPWLGARIGSERLLVIGAAIFAARALALLIVDDPILVAATMALHGAAFALVLVGGVTFVSRHAPEATAATAQGILSATVFSVALIVGPGVGSWIAGSLGVPALFGVALAASMAAIPLLWLATHGLGRERPIPTPEATR